MSPCVLPLIPSYLTFVTGVGLDDLAKSRRAAFVHALLFVERDLSDDERQTAINGTLVKREGSPQHVADAVVCLVENDFITGVCLPVDGGRTIASPNA